jgi:hypothetical protein
MKLRPTEMLLMVPSGRRWTYGPSIYGLTVHDPGIATERTARRCQPSTDRGLPSEAKCICSDLQFQVLDQTAIHSTITPHQKKGPTNDTN